MLFEIEKPKLYSATTTGTSTLFLFYHGNTNEVGQSVTSFLNKTAMKAVPCFRNADDWFSF